MQTIWAAGLAALLVAAGAVGAFVVETGDDEPAALAGVVVDPRGHPIAGAEVTLPDGSGTVSDGAGRFQGGAVSGWVTARAEGWVPRTRAGAPGEQVVIRLAPNDPDTVTFAFGGDVMFGRRYYDPQNDGSGNGLLTPDAGVADHKKLLAGVAPLFADADIAAVNLETPLINNPYYDPTQPRPARFHPTKDLAFASQPAAATALRDVGIDVVDLGNNHLYDALGKGVRSTRAALVDAGFAAGAGFFGAGRNVQQAWAPAYRSVRGHRIAFLGCTSVLGDDQPLTNVADRTKAGAAACSPDRVTRAVREARRHAEIVVMMIHGGNEYDRRPSTQVRALSDAAVAAGATMVINHHPHVVGGLRFADGRLTAWTLGNLLFDQTVSPTFESYVLQVAVRDGRVTSAWLEPLRIQDFQPTGVYGEDAHWVAQGALARSTGPWVEDDGSLWLDAADAARTGTAGTAGGLARIEAGCAPGAGRELLWNGDFEVGDLAQAQAPLWNAALPGPYRKVDPDAAHHGETGVLLHRGSGNTSDVLLSVNHRVPVTAGDELTFLADAKARFGYPDAELRLSWYNDTRGGSQEQTVVPIPADSDWSTLRVDVTAPRHAVAVQPFIALHPPAHGVTQLAVDDVSLVNWNEPGCDYLRQPSSLTRTALPPLPAAPRTTPIDAIPVPVTAPTPLPPGPPELGE